MGSARKQLGSIPSSRSSRRRVELEAQIFEKQTEAEIRKKQQEIELKRKQREMELAIAKEELELEEMTRKKKLHLKMKKLEIMERASSRSSICSMDHSETEKAATTKDWLESSRNLFNHSNEDQRQPNLYVKNKAHHTTSMTTKSMFQRTHHCPQNKQTSKGKQLSSTLRRCLYLRQSQRPLRATAH